jgi:hypothetical protein
MDMLGRPPTKEGDQWHPKKQKLGVQVDRTHFIEETWRPRCLEELLQEGTEEEHEATAPSVEKDTIEKRKMTNHLWYLVFTSPTPWSVFSENEYETFTVGVTHFMRASSGFRIH